MALFGTNSIKSKLIFIQSATALLAVFFCAAIFVINDIKIFKENSVRKMYSVIRIVGDNSVSPLQFVDKDAANKILLNLDKEPDIKDAILVDKSGNVFARYTRPGAVVLPLPPPDSSSKMTSEFSGRKLLVKYGIFQENEFMGTLILRTELTDLDKIITNYILIAAAVLLVGLLAAYNFGPVAGTGFQDQRGCRYRKLFHPRCA